MYEKLYADNRALLWYFANRYANAIQTRGDIDVDDLFQSGFFALVEASESYSADKGSWGSWASYYIRKTIRECVGLRGKKQITTASLDAQLSEDSDTTIADTIPDESLAPSDSQIIASETRKAIEQALEAVKSEKARLALRFVYLEGNSYAQAAQRIGVNPNSLGALLSNGRVSMHRNAKLRKSLNLDAETRFIAHKGLQAFRNSGSSVVEDAVIWREEQREKASESLFQRQ